ncbi:MAG: hypothetical protein HYS98_02140 [Deltaproteobacteria bacterium]|nr:hypothetical protein [Deltaproteobacteria bacterium]
MERGGIEHHGNIGDSETETFRLEIKDGVVHLELFLGEPKHKWDFLEFSEEVGRVAQKFLKKK